MKFQSHIPGFVDADLAIPKTDFSGIDELLNHPWIKGWNRGEKDFRYCWSTHDGRWSKAVLMAEWFDEKDKKKHWWVLGYMDEIPNLPKWECPKDQE